MAISQSVILKSHAKINLYLKIIGKKNNFHMLDSFVVFASDLYDVIHINDIPLNQGIDDNTVVFTRDFSDFVDRKNNSITNVIDAFRREVNNISDFSCLNIAVEKNIPVFAGLGGGSSNAAVLLNYLCSRYNISDEKKMKIACTIGSDGPLCIGQSQCFFLSDENIIEKSHYDISSYYIVLIFPYIQGVTKEIFSRTSKFIDFDNIKMNESDKSMFMNLSDFGNDLEQIFSDLYPEINKLKYFVSNIYKRDDMLKMTGSGSTYFAIFDNVKDATILYDQIKKHSEFQEYKVFLSKMM